MITRLCCAIAIVACCGLPVAALAAPVSAAPPAVSEPEDIHPAPPNQLLPPAAPLPDMATLGWRHGVLTLHQGFGLATLGAMAVTAGLGLYQSNMSPSIELLDTHLVMAGLTTGLYVTSATLALAAPPRASVAPGSPWDTSELHKNLGWFHAAGLGATVGLGLASVYGGSRFAPYHAIAGLSTLGLMALSAGIIAFGE